MLDRTEIQAALKQMNKDQEIQRKRDATLGAIAGESGATAVARSEARQNAYTDALSKIASNASILKDGYMNNWQNHGNNYFAQRIGMSDKIAGIHTNNSNQWATTATNLYSTGANLAGQYQK